MVNLEIRQNRDDLSQEGSTATTGLDGGIYDE
jgi:hypothetical protein